MTVHGDHPGIGGTAIDPRIMTWARLGGGVAILAVLVWQVGAGPFVDGLRLTTAWALAAALAITLLTTMCCAWRWSLIAGGLGVDVPLWSAVGAYYRSQFLNSTLPGGVLGDVHRGVVHGRTSGDLGRGVRSVAWERGSGQAVQVVLTAAVLLLMARPAGWLNPWVIAALMVVAGVAVVIPLIRTARVRSEAVGQARQGASPPLRRSARIARAIGTDLRDGVLTRRIWPGIVIASAVAVLGHVTVFAVALRAAGANVPAGRVLPLALVVLLAAAVPMNIAGWGPREGAAAWAFGAVGLTAADGVTVAVVYGVLALVATLPGAVLLLADRRRDGWLRTNDSHRIEVTAAEDRRAQRAGGVRHA